MPSVQPVVYNHNNLVLWQSELPTIQQKISENLQLIEEQRHSLLPLQEQLRSVNSLISSAQLQLTSANISANQDMMHHMHHNYGHHHHHHHHDGVLHVVGDVMRAATIASLQSELDRLQRQRVDIVYNMRPYETRISQEQASLSQAHSRQEWLKKHIPTAELFLQNLQAKPLESVTALATKLVNAFTDYEKSHLVGLSPQVRISLMAVRYGLNQLLVYPSGYAPDYINAEHRKNYLRLSGFLWDMYVRVRQEDKDAQFEKILGDLVKDTHILEEGDLPDQMGTNFSAKAWFQPFKSNFSGIFAIPEYDLTRIEADMLNQGITSLTQSSLPQSTSLHRHIVNAAKLIDAEVKIKKQKNEDIDYHFYGRTVRILTEVFNKPTDKQAAKHLADIAESSSGHTSVGKQVLGGLVVVLGVLLIATSIAGFVASLGSSSILSAWGVALGLFSTSRNCLCSDLFCSRGYRTWFNLLCRS